MNHQEEPWETPHRASTPRPGTNGTTGRLFGGRVGKDDLVIEACGDVDEAVTALGIARAALADQPEPFHTVLILQRQLFVVAADLMANPRARHQLTPRISQVTPDMVDSVEQTIDRLAKVPLAGRPFRAENEAWLSG